MQECQDLFEIFFGNLLITVIFMEILRDEMEEVHGN